VGDTFAPRAAQAASGGNTILGQSNDAGAGLTSLNSSNGFATLEVTSNGTPQGNLPFAISVSGPGSGLQGIGEQAYGVVAQGGRAPLFLAGSSTAGPPTGGNHIKGEVFVDVNGALFQCVATGAPGTFVRVGFNALDPIRIFDTRNSPPLGQNASTNLAVGGQFGVPIQASAVVMNATVTRGTAASFLTIFPEGTSRPGVSNLNWAPGQTVANQVTVKLGSNGAITIFNAKGTVDVILDLAGFYS
jgi:hypothetical protein